LKGEWPDPDEQYRDRTYPNPEEAEKQANLPDAEEPSASGGFHVPGLLKIISVLIVLAFVGSILLTTLTPLIGSGDRPEPSSSAAAQEDPAYEKWIGARVSAALAESGTAGQARFLGVQFDDSIQHPIVGVLAEGIDPQNPFPTDDLQSSSLAILQRLFDDERAQSVTLAWLLSAHTSGNGQSTQVVIMMIGMLRQTAQGIDWTHLGAEDLRNVADLYWEAHPSREQPTIALPTGAFATKG